MIFFFIFGLDFFESKDKKLNYKIMLEKLSSSLGIEVETLWTIVSSVLGVLSIFILVSIGYYLYSFFFENKNDKNKR